MYIYMHMHTYIYISPQLVHARLCNGAAASLPWNLLRTYLDSCANIVQTVVSAHPPSSSRPPSCWPVAKHVRWRNPIKSTLAHDAVAAVVLHKHHLIIRVGAGLIQFVYGSHSRLAADLTLDTNLFPLPFSRALINIVIHIFIYANVQNWNWGKCKSLTEQYWTDITLDIQIEEDISKRGGNCSFKENEIYRPIFVEFIQGMNSGKWKKKRLGQFSVWALAWWEWRGEDKEKLAARPRKSDLKISLWWTAQGLRNRTLIGHEPLICSKMCFTKTELVQ